MEGGGQESGAQRAQPQDLGEQPARGDAAPMGQSKSPQLRGGLSAQRKVLHKFTTLTHETIYCANPTQAPGLGQVRSSSWALALGLFCGPHPGQCLLWSVQVSVSVPMCEEGLLGSRALGRCGIPA